VTVVLRWLFWFSCFVTVLIAIVTSTGRMLVPWLDDLEPQINALLGDRGIELRGFNGDWHGLNPIISAHSIRFNGGHARDVVVELDLLESALHSALVARRVSVGTVEVALVRSPEGIWQPGGQPLVGLPISIEALVRESDAISLPNIRVRFFNQRAEDQRAEDQREEDQREEDQRGEDLALQDEPPASLEEEADPLILVGDYQASAATRNVKGAHAGVLQLWNANPSCDDCASCEDCGVTVRYDLVERVLGLGGSGMATVDSTGLVIPAALGIALGAGGAVLEEVHGRWHVESGEGRGKLDVALVDLQVATGGLDEVSFRVEARADDDHESWRARIGGLRIAAAAEPVLLELADVEVSAHLEESLNNLAFAIDSVDLDMVTDVVHSVLARNAIVDSWLPGLSVTGEAHSVQLRMDPSEGQIEYRAAITDLSTESFKGVPKTRRADTLVTGYEQGVELVIDEDDIVLGFPDVFDHESEFQGARGAVFLWFESGYLGIRADGLQLISGDTSAEGGFVLSRPRDRYEQHLAVLADIRDMSVVEVKHYVPRKLSEELVGWLGEALLSGVLLDGTEITGVDPICLVPSSR
jgi:uncharacterized protein YhdP